MRRALAAWSVLAVLCGNASAQTTMVPAPIDPAAIAAASPVRKVNGQVGEVLVPAYQRQVSAPLSVSTSDGSVTWAFSAPFITMPTCWPSLAATSTTYVFDYPVQGPISATSVTFSVSAHPKTLTVASLALPIVLQLTPNAPPAGTTLTLSCIAPL